MRKPQERLTPPKFEVPVAATRIYDRNPEWKFHTDLGKAKNAIAYADGYDRETYQFYARPGEIWVLGRDGTQDVWELYYACEKGTYVNDLPWR